MLRDKLVPPHDSSAGLIPIVIAYFLSKDPRPYGKAHRVDRAAKYMSKSTVSKYSQTWINIVHSFLVIYIDCSLPACGQNKYKMNSFLRNAERFDLFENGTKALESPSAFQNFCCI